tara:strand:+ start:42 stop:557 length:516 start_codon:yes stop_codon:yes gene_type:complete
MEIQKTTPGKFGVNFGLVLGVLMIIISMLIYATDMALKGQDWPMNIYYVLFPVTIFYSINKYKKQNDGLLGVSEAIKTGIIVALISALVYVLYALLFNYVIDPSYNEQILEFSTNKIAESDAPLEAKEISLKMIEFFINPINGSLFWIAMSLFLGLIYSLTGGLVMKKTEA